MTTPSNRGAETGWMPIETAPCDGRELLLWLPYDQRFTQDPGVVEIGGSESDSYRAATAWRPLPDPPTDTPKVEEREGTSCTDLGSEGLRPFASDGLCKSEGGAS